MSDSASTPRPVETPEFWAEVRQANREAYERRLGRRLGREVRVARGRLIQSLGPLGWTYIVHERVSRILRALREA